MRKTYRRKGTRRLKRTRRQRKGGKTEGLFLRDEEYDRKVRSGLNHFSHDKNALKILKAAINKRGDTGQTIADNNIRVAAHNTNPIYDPSNNIEALLELVHIANRLDMGELSVMGQMVRDTMSK